MLMGYSSMSQWRKWSAIPVEHGDRERMLQVRRSGTLQQRFVLSLDIMNRHTHDLDFKLVPEWRAARVIAVREGVNASTVVSRDITVMVRDFVIPA
jgi:hypothetical protein